MDALALIPAVALPWCAGCAVLLAARWPVPRSAAERPQGRVSAVLGYGYFVGLLLLTLWMRLLSFAGIGFGRLTVAGPLLLLAVLAIYLYPGRRSAWARMGALARSVVQPPLPGWQRLVWIALLAWMTLRLATLAVEVAARPLYPWDAWTQWATKARVWYEFGRMVPFVPADAWLAGQSAGYFDAAPANPATIPLLQAWSAIALGRWDDSAMSWPWLFMLGALALALYGMLRDNGVAPLAALTGAYLVVSLPLLDTHTALAGYADLMLCGTYVLSALALTRWASGRDPRDGAIAAGLALACPSIAVGGAVWLLTLVPGLLVAVSRRWGPKLLTWALGTGVLALLVLARDTPMFSWLTVHLDYRSPWRGLAGTYFLLDNWHLLWYAAVALAVVGFRHWPHPPVAPLAAVVASALAWLLVAAMFSDDVAPWFPQARAINRATLQAAPLIVFLGTLLWQELALERTAPAAAPVPARDAASLTDA